MRIPDADSGDKIHGDPCICGSATLVGWQFLALKKPVIRPTNSCFLRKPVLLPCFLTFFLLYSSEQDSYKFIFINGAAPEVVIVKLQKKWENSK
jgi:hypothetical protein